MTDIAIYVQKKYARQAYKIESYNVRAWPGMELIRDDLERNGYDVDYCGAANVTDYKIILMSITSATDWYTFIAERLTWAKGEYTVIVGGAGVLNIRVVLPYADVFVFGRGEGLIIDLVGTTLKGKRLADDSVCYSDEFDMSKSYNLRQATKCYPYPVTLANGKIYNEVAVGCQRGCLFCGYTWQRKHVGSMQNAAGAGNDLWSSSDERTIFELDLDNPENWGRIRILGIDGFSERLRRLVNKPITYEMLVKLLKGIVTMEQANRVKLYNIVGYPTETESDWLEFNQALKEADSFFNGAMHEKERGIQLHSTPFRAVPGTPAATWEMSYKNYRGAIRDTLRQVNQCHEGQYVFFKGDNLFAVETSGTESLPTIVLDALILRGVEDDTEVVRKLSLTKKFWASNAKSKLATLEKYIDIDRLFRAYSWAELPSRYLLSRVPNEALARAGDYRLQKYGGVILAHNKDTGLSTR